MEVGLAKAEEIVGESLVYEKNWKKSNMSAVKGARKGKLLQMRLRGWQTLDHGKPKEALFFVNQEKDCECFPEERVEPWRF